jgi:histidinol-phosphate aminotransferase
MCIDRRELLRQLGTVTAATAFFPRLAESTEETADSRARLVRLNRNEGAYGPGDKAKAAFQQALAHANRYPAEDADLRAEIASAQCVRPENIMLGCGSTELLRMAAEVCLGPGKNLVLSSPTFESIGDAARLLGSQVRTVPLTNLYAHDLEAILARIDGNTGLVYICNPNNPTGTLTAESELEAFLTKAAPLVTVLIDEAYHHYVPPSGAYASWVGRAAGDPRLIVTRTFSKVYGLAGLRVGYAVSAAETAKRLAARRLAMDVNIVAVRVALAALADTAHLKKVVALNSNDRQEFFNQVNARMLRCLDSQTNFVLMRTHTTGKEVTETLRAKGILVGAGYPSFDQYIRVSLGVPEDMQAFWRVWDASMPHHPV